tara:strand:+ start:242 stop:1027 length:786 start_codon:yes stop_codon:yes gene_type:complete
MKYKFLIFLAFSAMFISCSSEDDSVNVDDQEQEPGEEGIKIYSKSEFTSDGNTYVSNEYFYNESFQIDSIRNFVPASITDYFSIEYNNDQVEQITKSRWRDYNSSTEITLYDEVYYNQNKIELVSEDEIIEIYFSGEYVDSTKTYNPINPTNVFKQTFTRNSENNLVENNTGGDIFQYSDFDSGMKLDPSGSGMEYELSQYFDVFKLKVSANNPTTINYSQSAGSVEDTYSYELEYDEDGFVTTSRNEGSLNFSEHFYIEL